MTQTFEEMFTKFGRMLDTLEKKKDENLRKLLADTVRGSFSPTITVKGRKPAKTAAAAPIKPAKPVKAAKRAGRPAKAIQTTATTRRPREGADRVVDRMASVMKDKIMGATDVAEALTKAGKAPNSENLNNYMLYMLSQNPTLFERVSRGKYRVISSGKADRVTSEVLGAAKSGGPDTTDSDLEALGIQKNGIAENPFPT